MRATRFSIGSLLVLIGILAVGLAALRNPSYLWASAAFTAALAAVVAAVVSTVCGRGARRAYWLGFALFGGTYLAICSTPVLRDSVCPRLITEAMLDVLYPYMAPDAPQPSPPFTITATINAGTGGPNPAPTVANPTRATPAPPIALNLIVDSEPTQMPAPASALPAFPTVTYMSPAQQPGPWAAWTAPDRSIGVGYRIGSISLVSSEAFRQIGHSLAALIVATLGGVFARSRYQLYLRDGQPAGPASP